jgi:hypothetical protein
VDEGNCLFVGKMRGKDANLKHLFTDPDGQASRP